MNVESNRDIKSLYLEIYCLTANHNTLQTRLKSKKLWNWILKKEETKKTTNNVKRTKRNPLNDIIIYVKGMITIRMAFSWTCQPNMKDPNAHNTIPLINPLGPRG